MAARASVGLRGCRSRNSPTQGAPSAAKSLPQAVRPGRHHPPNPCRTGSLPLSASRDQLKGDVEPNHLRIALALCISLPDKSIDHVDARVNTRSRSLPCVSPLRPMFRPSPLVLPPRPMFRPTLCPTAIVAIANQAPSETNPSSRVRAVSISNEAKPSSRKGAAADCRAYGKI